jgi:class 3 adenylate cyclase
LARLTETERHPTSRALVASFLFTDLVGFSKGTAAEQYAAKATLSVILRRNLATLGAADYRIKDTGDGALIAFVSNPEHALYMALAIAEDFGRAAAEVGFPANSLRTGLHLGSVKESIDLEARPNFIGDGINAAKRIMDFAEPGQITASRAFFDAVGCLDSAYAELFSHVGAPDDKHGRAHELYAVSPSAAVLEKLKVDLDLGAAPAEPAEPTTRSPAATKSKREPANAVATGPQARPSRAAEIVRKSALPVVAVMVLGIAALFVGTKLTEPNGSKSPQAPNESALTPATSPPATAPATSAERTVDAQTSPTVAPKPEPAPTVGAAGVTDSAALPGVAAGAASTPDSAPPSTAQAGAAPRASSRIKPKTDALPAGPASAGAAPDRSSPRCSRIMEKATLGEALSDQEKRELATSCR